MYLGAEAFPPGLWRHAGSDSWGPFLLKATCAQHPSWGSASQNGLIQGFGTFTVVFKVLIDTVMMDRLPSKEPLCFVK